MTVAVDMAPQSLGSKHPDASVRLTRLPFFLGPCIAAGYAAIPLKPLDRRYCGAVPHHGRNREFVHEALDGAEADPQTRRARVPALEGLLHILYAWSLVDCDHQ